MMQTEQNIDRTTVNFIKEYDKLENRQINNICSVFMVKNFFQFTLNCEIEILEKCCLKA